MQKIDLVPMQYAPREVNLVTNCFASEVVEEGYQTNFEHQLPEGFVS